MSPCYVKLKTFTNQPNILFSWALSFVFQSRYIYFFTLILGGLWFFKDSFPRGERNIAIYILSFSPTPNYKHPRENNCLVHTVQNSGSLFEDFEKSTYQSKIMRRIMSQSHMFLSPWMTSALPDVELTWLCGRISWTWDARQVWLPVHSQ